MPALRIDHVLILARDLAMTRDFLVHAADLREGHRPDFPFAGHWLYCGDEPLIHLAQADDPARGDYLGQLAPFGPGAVDHIALNGADYDALIERLDRHRIGFFERTVPQTREHQVFVPGPDCLKLEFLFRQPRRSP